MTVSAPVKLRDIQYLVKSTYSGLLYLLNTDAARARRGYKAEDTRVGIEAFRDVLPILNSRGAIQAKIQVAMEIQKLFQNIQDPRHLCEDQNTMAAGFALPQQLSKFLEFAAVVL